MKTSRSLRVLDIPKPGSLGCLTCSDVVDCGGLFLRRGAFTCTDACGERKCADDCDRVCPNNPSVYALGHASVNGFGHEDLGAFVEPGKVLPPYISAIEHGSYFHAEDVHDLAWAMVPLRVVVHFGRDWTVRFSNAEQLRVALGVPPTTDLVLSCIDVDDRIEPVWKYLFSRGFVKAIRRLKFAAVVMPNFSVFDNEPRTHHRYNRKRSLIVAEEFSRFGVPVVPFCHGNSPPDWDFWHGFLRERSELTYLAKEFQTGFKNPERGAACIRGIGEMQQALGRPLHLVSIGGLRFARIISEVFSRWTIASFRPFVSSTKRVGLADVCGDLLEAVSEGRPGQTFRKNHNVLAAMCERLWKQALPSRHAEPLPSS